MSGSNNPPKELLERLYGGAGSRPIHVGPASPPAPTHAVRRTPSELTPELLEAWAKLARQRGAECEAYACDLERQARELRRARGE